MIRHGKNGKFLCEILFRMSHLQKCMRLYKYTWRARMKVDIRNQLADIIELLRKITIRKGASEAQEQSING
jgi:hypothetical protein